MIQQGFNPLKSPESIVLSNDSVTVIEHDVPPFGPGEADYDHKLYGTLRKGGAVKFFTRECAGLCAATFSSVFSYTALQSVTRPLLVTQLYLSPQELLAVQRIIELPMALSFLIGLLSDCYPILGLRRKAYMMVGLVMNAIATLVIGIMTAYFENVHQDDRDDGLVTLAILMTAVSSFGCMFTYLCVHTRTIELSQQEPLMSRGSIQASYLVFRRATSLITGVFTYFMIGSDTSKPRVALSTSVLVTVVICILPVPVILRFWDEEIYSLPMSFKVRGRIMWKIMQQKAVWHTLAFVGIFSLFLGVKFTETSNVIVGWAGAAKNNALLLRMISDLTQLLVVVVWRNVFMNRRWRTFFLWAPVFQIVPAFVISAIVSFSSGRDRYLYRSIISLTNIGDGVTQLINIVPITEIVQEGSEGVTVGIVLSLQRLISIFVSTNTQGLFSAKNFYDPANVLRDDAHAHKVVFMTLVLNYAINGLSVFGLLLLPSQRLDAQQMRSFGGFTKFASTGMVVFALLLLMHVTVVNVLTFIPATACYRIVGGSGCNN